jgi:hypothetical protein
VNLWTATGHLDPLHIFLIGMVLLALFNTPGHWPPAHS